MTCKICNIELTGYRQLSKHIRDTHQFNSQQYYDVYLNNEELGKCYFCKNQTRFISIKRGYSRSCNNCRSDAAKKFRSELKSDIGRFSVFCDKVSKNQEKIWETRKNTGEKEIICQKIGNTLKIKNQSLSQEELKEKYGWLTKLSESDKKEWIENVMKQTGAHKWWKTATNEQITEVKIKRCQTMIRVSKELVEHALKNKSSYAAYVEAVDYITSINYSKYKHLIDPSNNRGKGYHLDHKFSKKAGFLLGISPEIIGSKYNLELLPAHDNLRKSAKCSISLEILLEKFNV